MTPKKLIIHPGWSKTGTSAIQKTLNACSDELARRGIFYSKKLQQIDNAHHRFALAFRSSGPYKSPLSPEEAIAMLAEEFLESGCHSLIISSELSPVYFDYQQFRAHAGDYFDEVELIFTVRHQSSLLLSLFSQLVSDPSVRFRESIFLLFMRNLQYLDFFQTISPWLKYVDQRNVKILPYSSNIISDFFSLLGLQDLQFESTGGVNQSIPPKYLLILQDQCRNASDVAQFQKRKKRVLEILEICSKSSIKYPMQSLFSIQEQRSVDSFYDSCNKAVSDKFLKGEPLFAERDYKHITSYSPAIFGTMSRDQ